MYRFAVIILASLAMLACQATGFEPNENFKAAEESTPPPSNGTVTLQATVNTTGAAISAFIVDSDGRVRGAIDSSTTATGVAVSTRFKTIDSNGCTTSVDAVVDNGTYTVVYLEDDGGGFSTFDKQWAVCANETLLDAERGATNTVNVSGNTTITISNVVATIGLADYTLTVDRGVTSPGSSDAECLVFPSAFTTASWSDRSHALVRFRSSTFGASATIAINPQVFRLPVNNYAFFCWEDLSGQDYNAGEKSDVAVLPYDTAQSQTITVTN